MQESERVSNPLTVATACVFAKEEAPCLPHTQAGILYYARERQYRHIHADALELIRRHGPQPELVYWKAYSTFT